MKYLLGLWQTVSAYTVPVRGTTAEEFEGMFQSCDALIVAKINRASMEPEDQTATAERSGVARNNKPDGTFSSRTSRR